VEEEAAKKALASMQALADAAASAKDANDEADASSSASSVAAEGEGSGEETDTSAYDSDATDLFHLEVEATATWETPQDKDRRVSHLLAAQMRRHPLVPPRPHDETAATSFTAVGSGLKLPAAHCAFRGCYWTGPTKDSIEEHVVRQHGKQLMAAEAEVFGTEGRQHGSSPLFGKPSYGLNMVPDNQPLRRFFMGYYRQAIAEIERGVVVIAEETHAKELPHGLDACQGVPVVGPSVDRRTFEHLQEVYNDEVICSMICFVCAQRRTHTLHPNSAIKRRHLELFKAEHTQRADDQVLRIHRTQQFLRNLCRKTFLHRFARQGTPLWNAKALGPMEKGSVVANTIDMPKPTPRKKSQADDASMAVDDEESEESWEWRRLYLASDGGFWDLICCPEDVLPTAACRHETKTSVHERHIVCKHCMIPICDECYEFIHQAPLYASPMALANDNFIGYTYETILKYKVTWLEAAAAQPAFTTMMCFYIEGDHGHLLEERMFESSFMTVVRGNVWSYHMPWEQIMNHLERTTSDTELAVLPHDPERLAHMVQ